LNAVKPYNTLNDTKQFVLELERVEREFETAGEAIEDMKISLMIEKLKKILDNNPQCKEEKSRRLEHFNASR